MSEPEIPKMHAKYSRRERMYKEDYLSICIYLNVNEDGTHFRDTVIYRKIKVGGGFKYQRGANLKPKDIPVLIRLLKEADEYLATKSADESTV